MARKTVAELQAIRNSVALVGRLSDSIFHVGPFSLGIDGVLSWIPGLGELYSVAAGGFILMQGVRAGVSPSVLAAAGLLLGLRTVASAAPIAGAAFADLFTAHKWAAKLIVSAIDRQLGVEPQRASPMASGLSAAL